MSAGAIFGALFFLFILTIVFVIWMRILQFRSQQIPPPEDVSEPPEDAEKTSSGLCHKLLSEGDGDVHPHSKQTVTVHYTGWQTNGMMFDSSIARGEPASFRLDQVIKGWTEGVQLMVVGETRRFWIPADLAYGERPRFGPGGMLVFDIELLALGNE